MAQHSLSWHQKYITETGQRALARALPTQARLRYSTGIVALPVFSWNFSIYD